MPNQLKSIGNNIKCINVIEIIFFFNKYNNNSTIIYSCSKCAGFSAHWPLYNTLHAVYYYYYTSFIKYI